MKRSSPLVLLAFVLTVSAALVYADDPGPWQQPTWKVVPQQFDLLVAVNASAGTVSIQHQGGTVKHARDLKTSAFTEIMLDGKKVPLSALTTGMHVRYTLGMDGETLAHIENVAPQQAAPTPVATATPSFPGNNRR